MTKKTSYGIIETIGGFVMAREYRHIQQYEKDILELKEQGFTHREVAEELGFCRLRNVLAVCVMSNTIVLLYNINFWW